MSRRGVSRRAEGCAETLEALHEEHAVAAAAVVVLHHALDLEADAAMEIERADVDRRRDGAHDGPAERAHLGEEALVERGADALSPPPRIDPDEVDIGLVGVRLRQEAAQEAGELAVDLGDEARPLEVDEEQAREHRRHLAPAPPGVDDADDAAVVRRARVPDLSQRTLWRPRTTPAARASARRSPRRGKRRPRRRPAAPPSGRTSPPGRGPRP